MDNYEMVKDAILNKRIIIASYDGYRREMCPHCIGWKNGRRQALFYQFGGGSSTGLGPPGSAANWRCIPIDGLRNVSVADGPWHTSPNHSRPNTCVDEVDVEVRH